MNFYSVMGSFFFKRTVNLLMFWWAVELFFKEIHHCAFMGRSSKPCVFRRLVIVSGHDHVIFFLKLFCWGLVITHCVHTACTTWRLVHLPRCSLLHNKRFDEASCLRRLCTRPVSICMASLFSIYKGNFVPFTICCKF